MKVLVLTNLFPPAVIGGYEIACGGVTEALARTNRVLVVTSDYAAEPAQACVSRELPFVQVRRRDILSAPLHSCRAAAATRRSIEQFRPDVIFIWNMTHVPQAAVAVALNSAVPVCFCVMEHWFSQLYEHDQFMKFLQRPRGPKRFPLRAAACAMNRVVPALRIARDVQRPASVIWNAEVMRAANPPPREVHVVDEAVIMLGTPRDTLFSQLNPSRNDQDPYVLFIGRVTREKGPDLIISALKAEGGPLHSKMRVVCAGPIEDAYGAELRSLASASGVTLELLGPQGVGSVGRLMESATAVIIPSRWMEPAPLVSVEAAFARVPIIAARSGGIPEQFDDREALFFDVDAVIQLARHLTTVIHDVSGNAERIARAREKAELYRFDRYCARVEAFLQHVVRDSGGWNAPGVVDT